ncbi:MAG: class I SAM-dependent methyltransferase [Verrucomicrobiota bacterium]
MSEKFRDHFSSHAELYASARPTYPAELFQWLVGLVDRHDMAWDAATGNGQAAVALKPFFSRVHATDASAEQIRSAPAVEGISFLAEAAESPSLEADSVDMITVAQAAHWFDLDRFFKASAFVLRPEGVLALWCYERCTIASEIDAVIESYYQSLDPYWPPQRALIESRYATLEFPFLEIPAPAFEMKLAWTSAQLVAYLESWSATQRAAASLAKDPLASIRAELPMLWGDETRIVRWPIAMRVGRSEGTGG